VLAYDLDANSNIDCDASAVGELDLTSQVARAGLRVLEQLAEDLGDLAVSIVLTDAHANVIGSVRGEEHRTAVLADDSCVSAPIEDPRLAAPVGAVCIRCASANEGAQMRPYARLAARTIAERVLDAAAVADRVLLEHFLRARRRARGPIVGVNGSEVLTNAAAARLVRESDHAPIWNWATRSLEASHVPAPELRLRGRTIAARCEPVRFGRDVVGAIVYLEELGPIPSTGPRQPDRGSRRPTFGWGSLRSSELGIADLVSEGLTNREVGARLFVSPHTVDFHLRQIFRKLSITSRTELTRLVVEHSATFSELAPQLVG
jgi:DNA-binding CsgD family transcriptional regulator